MQHPIDSPALHERPRPAAGEEAWLSLQEALAPILGPPASAGGLLVSPRLVRAWAQVLVMHWCRLERLGTLDLSQPLYVLDLAPADGLLARGVLNALHEELHARGMLGWPVRYVLCPLATSLGLPPAQWLADPVLREFATQGWLDWANWPARTGQPLLLGKSRFPLFGARNPVSALCAGGLSAMPAQLYATHFGRLMRGRLRLLDAPGPAGARTIDCDWQPQDASERIETSQAVLLEHYRTCVINAPLLVSEASLALADALADFSGGRYLMLAADRGVASDHQISLGAMAFPAEVLPGQACLPVNFHALALHQRNAGARACNLQGVGMDLVLHLACRDERAAPDDASWQALVRCADGGHPADRWPLCADPPQHPVDRINARLRNCGHDPWALAALLVEASDLATSRLREIEDAADALRQGLAMCWQQLPPAARGEALCASLADLLLRLGDWALAGEVLAGASAEREPVLDLQRAHLSLATGSTPDALSQLRRYLARCPGDMAATELRAAIELRERRRAASRWQTPDSLRDGELTLELLDDFHVEAWVHELRDPAIAQLAGLPEITTAVQALAHLRTIPASTGAEYAVMHRELGFVGVVGLRCLEDMGHVHFWIGSGHQGRGLGGRAVQLLCRWLRELGIRHAFTSVYRLNTRSQRVLARAGFAALDYQGHGTDAGYAFMHLALRADAPAESAEQLLARLRRMCAAMGESLTPPTLD
jgi:RimJ/RimL family protein N-acetyltransferase